MTSITKRLASFWRPRSTRRPIVAGMATIPSRAHTFPMALRSIIDQVDRLYLYLDGYDAVPPVARDDPRIVPISADAYPGLRGNGKFLGLTLHESDCLYVGIDDDIAYPRDYVRRMRKALAAYDNFAVVGYHGSIFLEPFTSFAKSREVIWFGGALPRARLVDVLGTGTAMFDTRILRFDVRTWPSVNMLDLHLAIEAAAINLPLICLRRPRGYLCALEESQGDSIYAALLRDDSRETALALDLRKIRAKSSQATQT